MTSSQKAPTGYQPTGQPAADANFQSLNSQLGQLGSFNTQQYGSDLHDTAGQIINNPFNQQAIQGAQTAVSTLFMDHEEARFRGLLFEEGSLESRVRRDAYNAASSFGDGAPSLASAWLTIPDWAPGCAMPDNSSQSLPACHALGGHKPTAATGPFD